MQYAVPPIRFNRPVCGMSAVLLPFHQNGEVDWISFVSLLERTLQAGLIPAVNMDTGYGNLIDDQTREAILARTHSIVGNRQFIAGAFVKDAKGDSFNLDGYRHSIEQIQNHGGIPIIFQSFGLVDQNDEQIVESYRRIALECDQFYAFELGNAFAAFGSVYSMDVYGQLLSIENCLGAKHSSLSRQKEWDRLKLRDQLRPSFKVLTGNDLAIDMIMYGSDYLLGLSTFAPDLFAIRDAYWRAGNAAFYELNDVLQYLGFFAFRTPTPAYKHSAAMFLYQRGWITTPATHRNSPSRPDSDMAVLSEIGQRLGIEMIQP
jgi:dihydrodipicolinate synthase/N-acetylneuraminate lyase